jgi:rhodanese-related sulfurtransferase
MFGFGKKEINTKVAECKKTFGAILLDVREKDEFEAGHIPGAVNVPLSKISEFEANAKAPLYIYCGRGSRARRAAAYLKKKGYKDAAAIGGIASWKGETVK